MELYAYVVLETDTNAFSETHVKNYLLYECSSAGWEVFQSRHVQLGGAEPGPGGEIISPRLPWNPRQCWLMWPKRGKSAPPC